MSHVSLRYVTKRYAKAPLPAVKAVTFDVEEGELLVILGPSGCGKTSTLRMVAGLESVTAGEISFDARVVNSVPPARRNVAMAFENYGLYEHWSVYDNIAYPLRLRGQDGGGLDRVVREMATKLDIDGVLDERPPGLSGGVRQRVGLARALVRRPSVFLLDEPMSHVDADLRNDMRAEIKRIHQDVGSTMVIVTHDQLDAMAMADRILVMNDGMVEQHDTPDGVYERPATAFVAGFIGEPPMNSVKAQIGPNGQTLHLEGGLTAMLPAGLVKPSDMGAGKPVTVAFRPHRATVSRGTNGGIAHGEASIGEASLDADRLVLPVQVYMVEPLGERVVVTVRYAGELLKAEMPLREGRRLPAVEEHLRLSVRTSDLHLFDAGTGARLNAD